MKTAFMLVMVLPIFLGGCATTGISKPFDDNGLPRDQYYVGGGFSMNYRAPVRGTAYVVEENSRKLILTESLEKSQVLDLDIDPREEDVHMRLKSIGVDPLNMKLGLYFVPLQAAEQDAE